MTTTRTSATTARTSDGDTLTVRTIRELASVRYVVTAQRVTGRGVELVSIDGSLYLAMRSQLVKIRHDSYSHASTVTDGARKALAFALDGAEATLAEATRNGDDVTTYYA